MTLAEQIEKVLKSQTSPMLLNNRPSGELNWGICFGQNKEGYKDLAQAIAEKIELDEEEIASLISWSSDWEEITKTISQAKDRIVRLK